ncbi:MAG: WYL domain-containing protein, partial [Candidatus Margulisiibacteriota bacterium]
EHKGYYYQEKGKFSLPPLKITEGDLFAMLLTEQALASVDSNYLYQKIEPSIQKLKLLFRDQLEVDPSEIFSFGSAHQAVLTKNVASSMETILKAIREKRLVQIQYHALWKNESSERIVEPYHLRFNGKWYLAGYCRERKDYRLFVLQRIKSIKLLKEKFVPRDFSQEEIFGQSWGVIKGEKAKVLLEFNRQTAPLILETCWHPTQKLEPQKNGALRMRLEVDGLLEIMNWILSFGSAVTVLEPKELKTQLSREAKEIARKYA